MSGSLPQRLARSNLDWIVPDWPAPRGVYALSTTRNGGVSIGARTSLDLGAAKPTRDAEFAAVCENRRRLEEFLPAAPVWLSQVHGSDVVEIDNSNSAAWTAAPPTADAAVTRTPGIVLGVRHADCLPVLFTDNAGTVLAAAHAGWRGLVAGVLESTLRAMGVAPDLVLAWLGPAIGPSRFEVGRDVFDAFCIPDPDAADCFAPLRDGKWHADLYALARRRLNRAGVAAITGGGVCTMTETERFFSYRRDHDSGRMATLAWLDP